MSKRVLVLLAEGFEEVEAITPIDYLRRVGLEVITASIGEAKNNVFPVKSARAIIVNADTALSVLTQEGKLKTENWDAVVVPGGLPGSDNLAASKETGAFLKEMAEAGKLVSAICAAPARVLAPLGILKDKNFTCYPGEEEKVTGAKWKEDRVVVDGNILTSRGAGSAGEFACGIISYLLDESEAKALADKVLMRS